MYLSMYVLSCPGVGHLTPVCVLLVYLRDLELGLQCLDLSYGRVNCMASEIPSVLGVRHQQRGIVATGFLDAREGVVKRTGHSFQG